MRSSELLGVVVAFDETAAVDLNVVVIVFCCQRVGTPGCAMLRPVHPGPGVLVFGLTTEPLKVNFQCWSVVRGRVSRRHCPGKFLAYRGDFPLRMRGVAPRASAVSRSARHCSSTLSWSAHRFSCIVVVSAAAILPLYLRIKQ